MPQTAHINSFPLGIDQSLPPSTISDGALADAINMVLNERQQPETRGGTFIRDDGTPSPANARITSIYDYHDANGNIVLFTFDNKLATMSPNGGTVTVLATTLPTDTLWQWVTFNDIAIGVNRGFSPDANPVTITGTAAPVVSTIASAPDGRYIEVWNNRVFIVPEDEPYTLRWSALGDHTDWTTVGKAGAGAQEYSDQTYGEIRGIKAQTTRLIIFRERSIEVLNPGSPNVDTDQWQFDTLSSAVGCISAYSIQAVLNDLVFASTAGIMLLSSVEKFGNFENAVLSRAIPRLRQLDIDNDSYPAVVDEERSHYWISIPQVGQDANTEVWVLDFSNGLSPTSPWMKWIGPVSGASYGLVERDGRRRVFIGRSNAASVLEYAASTVDLDDGVTGVSIEQLLETKHFDLGQALVRKDFYKLVMSFTLGAVLADINLLWFLDGNKTEGKSVKLELEGSSTEGLIWSFDLWDNANWAEDTAGVFEDAVRVNLRGGPGRRARTLGFLIFTDDINTRFTFKDLQIYFDFLNELHIG